MTPTPVGGERADDHALRLVEYPGVLELVAAETTSGLGAEEVRGLRPHDRVRAATEALAAVDEMVGVLLRDDAWTPPRIVDARGALRRLAAESSVLEAEELVGLAVLLASARRGRRDILRHAEALPRLAERAGRLVKAPEIRERLEGSFDEAGAVADRASSELARLRRDLRDRRSALVSRLERVAEGLPERVRVPDASVTLRNGRYCIPLRREGRGQVGGIVHDESASRQTLFVEPPGAIEPMNEIRELEMAEAREVRRILAELTDLVRPIRDALEVSLRVLTDLDSLYARARYALAHGGSRPELGSGTAGEPRGDYRVVEGRHPLLLAADRATVPFSLELAARETVLLVSGPNTGGKTVLLKTIGLLSAMAQSGIVPPLGPGSRLPWFDRFFALIGDEQSIEASLSTFSAQVANLREMLGESDGGSLVLVDEVGSHTDPAEGAALATAVLLRLAGQAGLTVATTHFGALKSLAGEDPRVVNASLQFDRRELRPTFALERDRPGRSYALEIAGRLGIPEEVLEDARRRTSEGGRALETVLEELERREEELERRLAETRRRAARLERRDVAGSEREAELETRERELERREAESERRARREAERYLLEARDRVERAIARLERRYSETGGARTEADEAAAAARREVEGAVREVRRGIPEPPARGPGVELERLEEGTPVRVRSLDRVGRVHEVRGDRVVVTTGGVRLTVPAADLDAAPEDASGDEEGPAAESRAGAPGSRPEIAPRPEVDLRGLRVEEVERELLAALDAAILGDLPRLLVIHGKGTGAVRRRVRELLRADDRVPRFRPGGFDEGGNGVTVVEFGHDEG